MNPMVRWGSFLGLIPAALVTGCFQQEGSRMTGSDQPEPKLESLSALTSNPAVAGFSGCWSLKQGIYKGTLTFRQSGTTLTGFIDWDVHPDAYVQGVATANGFEADFKYVSPKEGLVGHYSAILSANGTVLTGNANDGNGNSATFTGKPIACSDLSGCWSLKQEHYTGTLTMAKTPGKITGFMDWDNASDATVTGTVTGHTVKMTFTYLGEKKGQVGIYQATLDGAKLKLEKGITYDQAIPTRKVPWTGEAVPCKELAGCFAIDQTNKDGGKFTGSFRLAQSGLTLSGEAIWNNHPKGVLSGAIGGRALSLVQTFPGTPKEGLVGYYNAMVDVTGDYLKNGTSYSNGGDSALFTGKRSICPAP